MLKFYFIVVVMLSLHHGFSQLNVEVQNKRISLIKDGQPLVIIDSVSINFIAQQSQEIIYKGF